MSVTQSPPENNSTDTRRCTRCHNALPRHATFCSQCGERVAEPLREHSSLFPSNITELYRITSLARRSSYREVFLATDTHQRRSVAIYDINISGLDEESRTYAVTAIRETYALLHTLKLPAYMPLIELHTFHDHLSIVAGWPDRNKKKPVQPSSHRQLFTLQDLLQSGIGLPEEQIAIAWIYRLCRTLEGLHKHGLVIGDIDPNIIFINSKDYQGDLALMISWLPEKIQQHLPNSLNNANASAFYAPEMLQGTLDERSDIYSLGAILYLLLTGIPPNGASAREQQPLLPLRAIDPEIGYDIEIVVMRALSLNKEERYKDVHTFAEALLQLFIHPEETQVLSPLTSAENQQHVKKNEEINVSSLLADNNNNAVTQMTHTQSSMIQATTQPDSVGVPTLAPQTTLQEEPHNITQDRVKTEHDNREELVEGQTKEMRSSYSPAYGQKDSQSSDSKDIEDIATMNSAEQPAQQDSAVLSVEQEKDIAEIPTQLVSLDSIKKQQGIDEEKTHQESGNTSQGTSQIAPSNEPEATTPAPDSTTRSEVEQQPTTLLEEPASSDKPIERQATTLLEEHSLPAGNGIEHLATRLLEKPAPVVQTGTETPAAHNVEAIATGSSSDASDISTLQTSSGGETDSGTASSPKTESDDKPQTMRALILGQSRELTLGRMRNLLTTSLTTLPRLIPAINPRDTDGDEKGAVALLKRVRRFVLGEPQNTTNAAALIETPMRVQPNQTYAIRINIIGRNKTKNEQNGGLSALVEGEKVHVEVRSALYQNYAYILQQANVEIPTNGFVAELMMPMQALATGPSGRRERLHILFMDAESNPLYEKPFAVEIFISHLVQNGREGHNVLAIPI